MKGNKLLVILITLTLCFSITVQGITTDSSDKSLNYTTAVIETSALNDSGAGNMLEITITEPDANNPERIDTISAKAGSGSSEKDLTIYLRETGINTGVFKYTLYFSSKKTNKQLLHVSEQDTIIIKYTDKTVPQGGVKDIVKTISWEYQSTVLTLDKEAYTGYNDTAEILLLNMELNRDNNKVEYVDVKVSTNHSKGFKLELKETKTDSGVFKGTINFGRTSKSGKKIAKVSGNDFITVSFKNSRDKSDVAECYATWSPQDGQITLDREEYSGIASPVEITLTDWDIAEDTSRKEKTKVIARLQGTARGVPVTLNETRRNSGIFTGTIYINGDSKKHTSIDLNPKDILEVVYTDRDTTTGMEAQRIATAVWTGVSKAELTLDNTLYKGYDSVITISVRDPDYNKRKTLQEKVSVLVRTSKGNTNRKYYLEETGVDTGVFTGSFMLSKDAAYNDRIQVADSDEITVLFIDKNVTAKAGFQK
ncbi:MAG: hypothetical protein ACOX3L_10135 [Lutisporaceae bacterium]